MRPSASLLCFAFIVGDIIKVLSISSSTVDLKVDSLITPDAGNLSTSVTNGLGQNETFFKCDVPDEWLMESGIGTKSFSPSAKWPNGVVKYVLHSSLTTADRAEVQKAFDEYHRKTCIRFVQRSAGDNAYTSIERDDSVCGLGHICRTGGYQFAKFVGGCINAGTMIHELGHNLCMGHEQSRPDRDSYIHFNGCSGNDIPGKNTNYNTLNSMYDFTSRMHYQCGWCLGGWPRNTNIQKCGSDVTNNVLSVLDVNKINDFYNCGGCLSYRFQNFQLLSSGDRSALFASGSDPNVGSTYICRAYHSNGDIIPGVYNLGIKTCYIAQSGETKAVAGDVLINPQGARLTWTTGGSIPSNAIAGGRTKSGETLYIAQARITINGVSPTIIGKIYASDPRSAYVSYGGREYKVTDFSILVCS